MKHLAVIQSEFLKEARNWDDFSYEEQKAYFKRHPKSNRRLTAKPGSINTNTKIKTPFVTKMNVCKGEATDSDGNKRKIVLTMKPKGFTPDLFVYYSGKNSVEGLHNDDKFIKGVMKVLKDNGYKGPNLSRAELGMQPDSKYIVLEGNDKFGKFAEKEFNWTDSNEEKKKKDAKDLVTKVNNGKIGKTFNLDISHGNAKNVLNRIKQLQKENENKLFSIDEGPTGPDDENLSILVLPDEKTAADYIKASTDENLSLIDNKWIYDFKQRNDININPIKR